MRISQLHLGNWRNFVAASCRFSHNGIFVGPNGVGKSNLLDALVFLKDLAGATGGGLQTALGRRGGLHAVKSLAAAVTADVSIGVELSRVDRLSWRYELRFGESMEPTKDRRAFIRHEQVIRLSGDGRRKVTLLKRPDQSDQEDPERLTETALEHAGTNAEFRELAALLRTIQHRHVLPQVVRDARRRAKMQEEPYGGFLRTMAGAPEGTPLENVTDILKAAIPQLEALRVVFDEVGEPHLEARSEHWLPEGIWQREDMLSDGTLRLLGLIWAIQEACGPTLLQEPESSLSTAVIASLPALIAKFQSAQGAAKGAHQVFITTHSPELLADEALGLDEIFVLEPTYNGTKIKMASDIAIVRDAIEAGGTIPDVIGPMTAPPKVQGMGEVVL